MKLSQRTDALIFRCRMKVFLGVPSLFLFLLFYAGCAKLQYLDELLTLRGLATEQEQMARQIARQDTQFEDLVAAVQKGTISTYRTQKGVARKFGPPIYVRHFTEDDHRLDVWVYRHAVQFFGSPRVYLYWDESGHLIRWKYDEPQDKGQPASNLPEAV